VPALSSTTQFMHITPPHYPRDIARACNHASSDEALLYAPP